MSAQVVIIVVERFKQTAIQIFRFDHIMSLYPSFQKRLFSYLFRISILAMIVIWLLRGFGILAFLPGMILWILLFASIGLGVLAQLSR